MLMKPTLQHQQAVMDFEKMPHVPRELPFRFGALECKQISIIFNFNFLSFQKYGRYVFMNEN